MIMSRYWYWRSGLTWSSVVAPQHTALTVTVLVILLAGASDEPMADMQGLKVRTALRRVFVVFNHQHLGNNVHFWQRTSLAEDLVSGSTILPK